MFPFGFLCFLCMGWQYAAGSPLTVTEYEYDNVAGTWLRLHIVPATWSDAAVRCQLEGGVLASPMTSAMAQAMVDVMNKYNLAFNKIFIGATSRFSKNFESLDGVDLAGNLEWEAGEPDNEGNAEDCLALTVEGVLADVSCARVLPYFCRMIANNCPSNSDATTVTSPTTAAEDLLPTCEGNGYEWEPLTGSCYKFHGIAKPWRSALATCHAEGGHLAIINSDTEATVLKNLYNENQYWITGAQERRHALIGFRKFDDGVWATIFGEPLADAGYDKWDIGEPSNGNGYKEKSIKNEYCGSIHRNGLINDASCIQTCPFICEITA